MNGSGVVQLSRRARRSMPPIVTPNGETPTLRSPRLAARWDVDLLCFATQRESQPNTHAEARLRVVVVHDHPVSVVIRRPEQDWDLILLPKEPAQRALLLDILAAIFGVTA